MTKDNHLLGCFDLVDIAPAPRGVPQIKVTFELDKDGILNVTAVDTSCEGKSLQITPDKGGLSKEIIDRLVKETAQLKL